MSCSPRPLCSSSKDKVESYTERREREKAIIMEGTLKTFKVSVGREEFIKNNWSTYSLGAFQSQSEFFQYLDSAHEDTLRIFTVKQLFQYIHLDVFLKSFYAPLSDEQFVECNGMDIDSRVQKCVMIRLSFIQKNRGELIFPTGIPQSIGFFESFVVKVLSLKQIRNLDTEGKIERVFSKHRVLLSLLSITQKGIIEDEELFGDLMSYDDKEEKRKYLPYMTPEVLNARLRKLKKELDSTPSEVIPLLNLSMFSDSQVFRLIFNNLKDLHKLPTGSDWLNVLIRRLLLMSTTSDETNILIKNGHTNEIVPVKRKVPRFQPYYWERIHDSVFAIIPFHELTKDELLCIFHPKSIEIDSQFGSVFAKDKYFITEYNYLPLLEDEKNRSGGHPSSVTIGLKFYQKLIQQKEEYNERRIALLTPFQYKQIRSLLHPEIVKLGNKIFPEPLQEELQASSSTD